MNSCAPVTRLNGSGTAKRLAVLLPLLACLFTPLPGYAQSTYDTIEATLPRVVKIFGAGGIGNLEAYGTGLLVSPEGHIVTVWSHVLDVDPVTVVLHDGRRFDARVLGAEPPLDMAVIKIIDEDLELPFFDLDAVGTAGPGTRVLAFSNMFNVATGDEPVSVIHGVIAARTTFAARRGTFESPYNGPVYVLDAVTNNSGAGGGAITTRDGKLLGLIGKELRNATSNTWVNYAVPFTELKDIIQQIISGKFVSKQETSADRDAPERYSPVDFGVVLIPDVVFRTPAYVDSVITGSPAEAAGIRPDDLLLFINDELIQSCRMLRREIGRLEAGDTLRLILRRENQLLNVELAVPRKPDAK